MEVMKAMSYAVGYHKRFIDFRVDQVSDELAQFVRSKINSNLQNSFDGYTTKAPKIILDWILALLD